MPGCPTLTIYYNNNTYLLNYTYNNSGYKWTPQEVILVHVINNCEGPRTIQKQIVTFFFLCFDISFIKFLINTREKQELPGVELLHTSLSSPHHVLRKWTCAIECSVLHFVIEALQSQPTTKYLLNFKLILFIYTYILIITTNFNVLSILKIKLYI